MAQDFMRETFVMPLLYAVWVGGLIFESIPQTAIWSLFLIITLPIALRSLIKKRPASPRPPYLEPSQPERIQTWLRLLQRTDKDDYYKWQLAQRLQKLALEALAHDERLTMRQVRQRLANDALNLPPEVQAYLQAGMTSLSHFLRVRSPFRLKRQRQPTPLDLDPERVVEILEDKFEYHLD
jgi:hypothetical protein